AGRNVPSSVPWLARHRQCRAVYRTAQAVMMTVTIQPPLSRTRRAQSCAAWRPVSCGAAPSINQQREASRHQSAEDTPKNRKQAPERSADHLVERAVADQAINTTGDEICASSNQHTPHARLKQVERKQRLPAPFRAPDMHRDPQQDAAVNGEQFISQKNIIGIPALPVLWQRNGHFLQHPCRKSDQEYASYQREDFGHCSSLPKRLVESRSSCWIARHSDRRRLLKITSIRNPQWRNSWLVGSTHTRTPPSACLETFLQFYRLNVRFGSEADICAAKNDVCFTANSDRESGLAQW